MKTQRLNKKQLRLFIKSKSWFFLSALWIMGIGLAYAGFSTMYPGAQPLDKVYLTLQLVLLESGGLQNPPLTLGIARFLLPLLAAQAGVSALASVFARDARQFSLRFSRSHVIVFGTGPLGEFACRTLLEAGDRVVYISPCANYSSRCMEDAGATAMAGNPDDPKLRRRANLKHASHLLAFCEEDERNISIALQIEKINLSGRKQPLRCAAHIQKKWLAEQFVAAHYAGEDENGADIDVVNVYALGARTLARNTEIQAVKNIFVAGYDEFIEHLIIELAIQQKEKDNRRRNITLIEDDAESILRNLCESIPDLKEHCLLAGVPETYIEDHQEASKTEAPGEGFFIIRKKDLADALELVKRLKRDKTFENAEMMIVTDTHNEVETLFQKREEGLRFLNIFDEIGHKDILLDILSEQLAREFHASYLAKGLIGKESEKTEWKHLSEEARESNRRAAYHIRKHLRELNYRLAPQEAIEKQIHAFTEAEIDFIARREHERWLEEKRASGWRYGEEKDRARKVSPYLKPWEALSEAEKEFNYDFVRIIPEIIAKARLKIMSRTSAK